MNEKRNPLRQRITQTDQLSYEDLADRYNQVLEARDDDWKRFRGREQELVGLLPAVEKLPKKSMYDLFSERMGKLAPAFGPFIAVLYVWWDSTAYPPPGKNFWINEQVQPLFQGVLLAATTLMFFSRLMAVIVMAMIGCLLFAYLFK